MTRPESSCHLRFGAVVEGNHGPLGHLHQVEVDPVSRRVGSLLLRKGFLAPRELQVPWSAVVAAPEAGIRLSLSAEETHALWGRPSRRFPSTASRGKAGNTNTSLVLSDRLPVRSPCGSVAGHLCQLHVEAETGEIREYAIESPRQSRRLPAEWVERISPASLEVTASLAEIALLPAFREDQELRAEILNVWFYDDLLRLTLLQAPLDVRVSDGIVRLEGYAPSREIGRRLEARARGVAGVRHVEGCIVTDEALVPEVSAALAGDPRTQLLCPHVESSLGVITLHGKAPDRTMYDAVSEVAASVSGVCSVINLLQVEGSAWLPYWPFV